MSERPTTNYDRIVAEVRRLSPLFKDAPLYACSPASLKNNDSSTLLEFARFQYQRRRTREKLFPAGIFADPAWDIMLDLYIQHLENRSTSISSSCIASSVPSTTALRWIAKLCEDGLIERRPDLSDGRRHFIALTDQALTSMTRYFIGIDDDRR